MQWNRAVLAHKGLPLLLSVFNGLMTLVFYVMVVYRYGVGHSSDLIFAISLIPNVLYTVTFGQLGEILVPYFARIVERDTRVTSFWNVTLVVALFGTAFGVVLIQPMVLAAHIFFPRLTDGVAPGLLWRLLLVGVIYYVIFCILSVKNSYLISVGKTSQMQFWMAIGNGVSAAWLFWKGNAQAPVQVLWAQTAGAVFSLFAPAIRVRIFGYVPGRLWVDIRDVVLRVRWLVVNASIAKTEPLVDSIIAGFLGSGAVTIYYFLQRIIAFTQTVVQNGYVLPFTGRVAELMGSRRESVPHVLRLAVLETSAVTLGLLASTVVGLVVMHFIPIHALQAYVLVFQNNAMVFVCLLGFAVFTMSAKPYIAILYVSHRERLYATASITMFVLGSLLKVAGARLFGLSGLALGSSIYCLLTVLVLARLAYSVLHRAAREARDKPFVIVQ